MIIIVVIDIDNSV